MNPPDPSPVPTPPTAQRVILVVDDDLATLRMLGDALTAEGYAVLAARDGVVNLTARDRDALLRYLESL